MFKRIVVTIFSIALLFTASGVFAHNDQSHGKNSGGLIDQLNENLRKQEELRNKIANAQQQQKSLKSEIDYLNNQIELTRLEIEETKTRLTQLASDIDDVTLKLNQTKEDIDYTESVAQLRLRTIYKQSYNGTVDSFLGSDSFNDFLVRQKYTEVIREQDLALLEELESLKKQFSGQKLTLEGKQKKEEELKKDLEQKNSDLAAQESSKEYVLGQTRNNEKEYQRLLAQVQSEIASIAAALGGGGVRLGPVKKGEVIAFQGNTGCSTGSHLHFGFYIGGRAVNPKPYLDSGALRWPLSSPTVTQWFGANYWWYWNNFGMPGHNGIDMVQYHGAPILAARDGVAYLATDGSACWLTGTVGKGIVIHHSNGWQTIYWHIQ
ncbi:MAG: peptidoglycan DD-metalloendopeptidase family protein [Candidatus Woykebacteria bacterium]